MGGVLPKRECCVAATLTLGVTLIVWGCVSLLIYIGQPRLIWLVLGVVLLILGLISMFILAVGICILGREDWRRGSRRSGGGGKVGGFGRGETSSRQLYAAGRDDTDTFDTSDT